MPDDRSDPDLADGPRSSRTCPRAKRTGIPGDKSSRNLNATNSGCQSDSRSGNTLANLGGFAGRSLVGSRMMTEPAPEASLAGLSHHPEGFLPPVSALPVREFSRRWNGRLAHYRSHGNAEHLEALMAEALRYAGLHLENDLAHSSYWSSVRFSASGRLAPLSGRPRCGQPEHPLVPVAVIRGPTRCRELGPGPALAGSLPRPDTRTPLRRPGRAEPPASLRSGLKARRPDHPFVHRKLDRSPVTRLQPSGQFAPQIMPPGLLS